MIKATDDVFVTEHSIDQATRRYRLSADRNAISKDIEREVRAAANSGRIRNSKAKWALLYRQKPVQFTDGSYFVYNASETRGWVIRRDRQRGDLFVVLTSLFRTAVPSPKPHEPDA